MSLPQAKRQRTKGQSGDSPPTVDPIATSPQSSPSPEPTAAASAPPPANYSTLYLDSVNRRLLDFDFEKVCSVSLLHQNVYACLVCGKYFQGRSKASHAYFHSINQDHHVYINLHTLKVYILPDGYEATDPSLNDIKYVINPVYSPADVAQLDRPRSPSLGASGSPQVAWSTDLFQKKYLPGFVGMNNIKANDYLNVVIQALAHVPGFRDYFLTADLGSASELAQRFGLLLRKLWNPRAFKGQVSPHELVQEVGKASHGKFTLVTQGDAAEFLAWFLNALHRGLGGSRKPKSSIVYRTFQGELGITTKPLSTAGESHESTAMAEDGAKEAPSIGESAAPVPPPTFMQSPFLMLSLDLPPAPLFQDEVRENIIPQIPLAELLDKYNGSTAQLTATQAKYHRLQRLPPYLIITIQRFSRSNFSVDKNPTLVTFPLVNLDLGRLVSPPQADGVAESPRLGDHYDLLSNISHTGSGPRRGKDGSDREAPSSGSYQVDLKHLASDEWYRIQDLFVNPIDPQRLFLSGAYIQIWRRRPNL